MTTPPSPTDTISADQLVRLLLTVEEDAKHDIPDAQDSYETLHVLFLGKESEFGKLSQYMRTVPKEDKQRVGIVLNQVKKSIDALLAKKENESEKSANDWMDVTIPGTKPPYGHLHIVTQAIEEITEIFNKIGFTRVRHPEVDWDWYAFESLNMPKNHPARDEWETFFITNPSLSSRGNIRDRSDLSDRKIASSRLSGSRNDKYGSMVLTPHTSNGQVREMQKGILPIRMINIAKCYRRQIDVSHTPMFHQFEGMYIDKNVSIGHLKGVMNYFVQHFFGPKRNIRLRPFHFQFTEPSFEIDISCGVCNGKGCKLCKEGWLELGGSGMIHPNVLTAGGIDTKIYNGFAFGWGIERTYMMKAGTELGDIRPIYGNDVRFLNQF